MGLILGVDLCDDYSQISCFNPSLMDAEAVGLTEEESSCLIPTAVCKERGSDRWLIGEEAYEKALNGNGTMIDKPVKTLMRRGSATIEGVRYSAEDLMGLFVGKLLRIAFERYQEEEIDQITFTVQTKTLEVAESLTRIAEGLGIDASKVHIINHSEAYLFYVLSQKKDIWANQTSLFDVTGNGLHYYELGIVRGRTPKVAEVMHEELEENFSLEILETDAGCRLGDKILTACAERLLNRKIVTAVFLTGRGFVRSDWAEKFLQFVCRKRRVFLGQNLFARGAAFLAYDQMQETSAYPYVAICEGRVGSTVSLKVEFEGRERQLILISAGSNWCEARATVDLILNDTHELDFVVTPAKSPIAKHLTVDLSELPKRPNKTTRIEVIVSFTGDNEMTVRVLDKGFGEFFPASDCMIRKDFYI